MRKILLSTALLFGMNAASAQTSMVAGFDTLSLPKADTFYVNYSSYGNDVGFDDGMIHFPCVYDTSFGYEFWSSGFVYSNMTDSITSGFGNQYSAKAGSGYNSSNYAIAYGTTNYLLSLQPHFKTYEGFYITNTTYAYNSMRDGDAFAKKFGDTTGTNSGLPQGNYPDWFKLVITNYWQGNKMDTVEFYLADFRFNDDDSDYIVRDWTWVDLSKFSQNSDSIVFTLSSSDNGQFGMNTPAYFCMDDFTSRLVPDAVQEVNHKIAAKIYPNPALHELHIETTDPAVTSVVISNMSGKMVATYSLSGKHSTIPTAHLPAGMYLLQLSNGKQTATQRFIKQ